MARSALTLLALGLAAAPLAAQRARFAPAALESLRAQEGRRAVAAQSHLQAARQVLGLDADHGFRLNRLHTDEFGLAHGRFQQTYQGLPVFGGEVITHQEAEGTFAPSTSDLRAGLRVNTTPNLTEAEALAVAHRALAPKGEYAHQPSAELVVYPVTTTRILRPRGAEAREADATQERLEVLRTHLAYHVRTQLENGTGETRHMEYLVDAHSGAILKAWDGLRTSAAVGTGKSQWYGTVSLNTNSTASGYELRDMTRGTGGTFGNNVTTNLSNGTSGNGTIFTDADNAWGDGLQYTGTAGMGANAQTAAVDGHRGLQATWDFYKNVFGRNGIDNTGKATYSRMHYSTQYDNAFWDDTCFCMTYGDGATGGSVGEADLDTAGHEMTHGVTSNSANLTYSGESGGLNESTSDIFGTCVEFYVLGAGGTGAVVPDSPGTGTITANYTMFENSWGHPGTALRYMYKPSKDGGSKDAWYSGIGSIDVHYSSGPMNRAWYFMSQGSSSSSTSDFYSSYLPAGMTGVGNDHAARIWYRALTVYLTASSNYAAARTAAISAAKDLYGAGSAEEQAVWNAFAAINVGAKWTGTGSDTTAPTVSATESGTSGTLTFSATASDNVGVTKVEFYVDGVLKGTDTTSPYAMTLDSTTLSNASHTLTAKAYDAAGNVGTSSSVAFTVSNTTGGTQAEVESNNSTSTANAVATSGTTVVGYISSSTDTDYFKVTLGTGRTLAATLTPPSASDFDLYIYNSAGTQVASSLKGTGLVDSASVTNSGASATYYVRVKYYSGASTSNPYSLKLTF
ncbi:MAG TPA: M4 family metallopeptidase [Holophagaceae bacterium]|nr:M4 family metallopeptidase [Holophagaceae bacterium]